MSKITSSQVREVVIKAPPETKLKLTFSRDAIADLSYLLGMNGKIITMPESSLTLLLAIISSKDWGGDANRILEIEMLPSFDVEWFVGRLGRRLDAISIISHPKKSYKEMTDDEVKEGVRTIFRTSKSEGEVKRRIKEELGYPYDEGGIALTSTSSGSMIMFMAMVYGPTGNVLSI